MTIREATGLTIYQRPHTFGLKRKGGYFLTDVIGKLLQEKEVTDWKQRHGHPACRPPGDRNGAEPTDRKPLPGPLTAAERSIADTSAPPSAQGKKI